MISFFRKKGFIRFVYLLVAAGLIFNTSPALADKPVLDFYSLDANLLNGENIKFSEYRGKVVLITNIALQCGTTPQLKALQELFQEFKEMGLIILAFPSNDFTGENLDDKETIQAFCSKKYSISFPVFLPGTVAGKNPQPVFSFLTKYTDSESSGGVEFNFEKFLVDGKGSIRARYGSFTSAQSQVFKSKIRELLSEVR